MPQRGRLVLVACEPCRRRKARVITPSPASSRFQRPNKSQCDGGRPACLACTDRGVKCTFISPPGVSRTSALKTEVAQLKTSNARLVDLFWQLKHASPSDAQTLIHQIEFQQKAPDLLLPHTSDQDGLHRTPANIIGPITLSMPAGHSPRRQLSGPAASCARVSTNKSDVISSSPLPLVVQPFVDSASNGADPRIDVTTHWNEIGPSTEVPLSSPPRGEASSSIARRPETDELLQSSLRSNSGRIREGFAIQRMCISEIFFCHDRDAVESLLKNIDVWQSNAMPSPLFCELCAVAATSGQYVRDLIAPGLLDCWYGKLNLQALQFISTTSRN